MAWWSKLFSKVQVEESREVKTRDIDVKDVEKVKHVSLRQLNEKDRAAIKKIEAELLDAGVLAPRGDSFETSDENLDEIIIAAYKRGYEVQELIGDHELDEIISRGEGGGNFMIDEFDEYEDTVYDVYEDTEKSISLGIVTDKNGRVAIRLPDGSFHYGEVPGHS